MTDNDYRKEGFLKLESQGISCVLKGPAWETCKRLPGFSILSFWGSAQIHLLFLFPLPPLSRTEMSFLACRRWPIPLTLSPSASEGREPCVGQGYTTFSCASPTSSWNVTRRRGQQAVAGWLPTPLCLRGHLLHASVSTGPRAPLGTSPRPRPLACLLVCGPSVHGAPWALGPHKRGGWGGRDGTAHAPQKPPPKPREGRK